MKPSFVLVLLLLLALVPASALAFRPAPGDSLARSVQVRALRLGDRGEQVAALQRALQERGFEPGPVDGIYGPLTQRAVRVAQERYQLVVDGLAGRLTVGALRNGAPAAAAAPRGTAAGGSGLVIYQAASSSEGAQLSRRLDRQPVESSQAARFAADTGLLRASSILETGPLRPALALPDGVRPFAPVEEGADAVRPDPVDFGLTFNGLPDEPALGRILQGLADRGMQATFFVWGEQAEARPDLLKRIRLSGHEVASLGYADLDMRRLSPVTAQALLRRTQRAIAEATGIAPTHFRPPQGLFDRDLTSLVEAEGLTMVLWSNVAVRPVPEMDAERLAAETAGSLFPGAVLMLPMDRANAVAAVGSLLDRLEAAGYRSRTLTELTGQTAGR